MNTPLSRPERAGHLLVVAWVCGLLCVSFVYLASPLIRWPLDAPKNLELGISIFGSLTAAFAGASAAFALNAWHEVRRQLRGDIQTYNQAMLVRIRQFNYLLNYRAQKLDPLRNHPAVRYALQPQPPVEMDLWHVDAQRLAFLVGTAANDLPLGFALQDDRFHSAVMAINIHARFHNEEVQPAIGEIHQRVAVNMLSAAQMDKELGPRLACTLQSNVAEIFRLVDQSVLSHERFMAEAIPLLQKVMPEGRFIRGRSPLPTDAPLSGVAAI